MCATSICVAKMRLYVIQVDSQVLVNNQRCIKIGYYHEPLNGNKTKYYMTAAEGEVTITEVRKMDHICTYSQYY